MPTALPPDERCVAHPGRPAVDRCPVCDRPRCGADTRGPGCRVCKGRLAVPRPPAPPLELVVRAGVAAHLVAVVVGVVLQEYPGSPVFQYVAPAVGGAAIGAVATAAAGEPRGPVLAKVRAVGVVYAVCAAAFGFQLEGTYRVLSASPYVLVPYALAAAAAWLWTRPPRRSVRASADG
jgi:hypothetical protein